MFSTMFSTSSMPSSLIRTAITSCLSLALGLSGLSGSASAANWAEAMFPVKTHDFGIVAVAADTEFVFPIKNSSDQDIHIASVRASCGCTTPILEEQWIRAGQEGAVIARFNTDTFRGKKGATLTVVIDRPAYAEVQLRVDGYIRRDMVFNPGSVQFGKLSAGETAEQRVGIAYAGRSEWQITGVESPQPYLDAEVREKNRHGQRVDYELVVRLSGDAPAGFVHEELIIQTNDRSMPRVPLQVSGHVEAPLSVAPQSFALGSLRPGEDKTQRLVIRGNGPFKITSIELDGFDVDFTPTREAKNVHVMTVRFVATDEVGKIGGPLVVRTDAGESLTAEAAVIGEIRDR